MSINITNFFNRVRNYFIPNSKRNLDITKINKTQLSLPASKFNSIPKVINTEEEAIQFAETHYFLPENFIHRKGCDTSLNNLTTDNQRVELKIKKDINSFFNSKIKYYSETLTKVNNNLIPSSQPTKKHSSLNQIGLDIPRMNIFVKNKDNNPTKLQSIIDINKYLGKLPPSHICHICNIANQAHLAEGTIKASEMISKTQSEFLFQDHGKSSIMINILDNNSYQVKSEGYFNLINTKTGKKVNNSEVIAETTTHFTFDEQDKLIAEKQDKLTLKIKIETNPPHLSLDSIANRNLMI
ncbi:hypothetical protein [Providencia hangzhouensis]|uniref:hypothetical protein n=1 Tax=Providencia hangzhouensis TaxID=3031799 RepID=UPI0034DD4DE7